MNACVVGLNYVQGCLVAFLKDEGVCMCPAVLFSACATGTENRSDKKVVRFTEYRIAFMGDHLLHHMTLA